MALPNKTRLENLEEQIVKKVDGSDFTALLERFNDLEQKYENANAKMQLMNETIQLKQNTIDILQTQVGSLRVTVQTLQGQTDRVDQYSMRSNLRIMGVSAPAGVETNEVVVQTVKDVASELGVDISDDDLFRAHRVGKVVDEINREGAKTGRKIQPIIVRFRSWNKRCELYKSRPKRRANTPQPERTTKFHSIALDLARGTRELLKKAQDRIKVKFPNNNDCFAFADINCNISIKLPNNKFVICNDENKLINTINSL